MDQLLTSRDNREGLARQLEAAPRCRRVWGGPRASGPSADSLNATALDPKIPRWAKDTKLLTWLENCYPAVGTKRAAVDEFLAGIADAQLDDWDPMKFVRPIGERERDR